jgi:hypothetical protein
MYILYFFLGIVVLFIIFWTVFLYSFTRGLVSTFFRGEAPFVPTKAELLPKIVECINLDEKSTLFDLGCGDARILVACCYAQPSARFVGFERDILPYSWSKFRLWMMGLSKKIEVQKKDFFLADFSAATHFFLYLGPKQMKKLEPILEREIKEGKKIISLQFEMPNRAAKETVNLGKEKLFVY